MQVPVAEKRLLDMVRHVARNQEPDTRVDITFVDFALERPNYGRFSIIVLSPHQAIMVLDIEEKGREETVTA